MLYRAPCRWRIHHPATDRAEQSLGELNAMCRAIVAGDAEGARLAGAHHVAQARYAALPKIFEEEFGANS